MIFYQDDFFKVNLSSKLKTPDSFQRNKKNPLNLFFSFHFIFYSPKRKFQLIRQPNLEIGIVRKPWILISSPKPFINYVQPVPFHQRSILLSIKTYVKTLKVLN